MFALEAPLDFRAAPAPPREPASGEMDVANASSAGPHCVSVGDDKSVALLMLLFVGVEVPNHGTEPPFCADFGVDTEA